VRLSARTAAQIDSPIGETYALLEHRSRRRELLDLAQAAPQYPPAPAVVQHLASIARHPRGADYVEIAGLPQLREAFAAEVSHAYRGRIDSEQVVVTAGCNQAFCLVATAIAEPGDEIIVALPYYFNHDMWLRMNGIVPVYLDPGPDLVPSAELAESLITPRTKAIVLVSPGNPSGVTLSPESIARFAETASRNDIALILDETYRSFRDTDEPAHRLFGEPDWPLTLISLHSFSKDLAIAGYRVGAIVGSVTLNRQVMKLLDCVAICAPRIGQEAAWAGLTAAHEWRAERAREVADKRLWFASVMADQPGGFELLTVGGFFGWVRHPFSGCRTGEVVRELAVTYDALVIPGTAFMPEDRGAFRVSFSNVHRTQISDFAGRLEQLGSQYRFSIAQ